MRGLRSFAFSKPAGRFLEISAALLFGGLSSRPESGIPEIFRQRKMNQLLFEKVGAWSGVICLILFFGAFGFAGFVPPMSPSLSVSEVAAHYQVHAMGIRVGMGLMLISSAFYAMFTAAISAQMQRIANLSPTVVYTQLACGTFACVTFLMPAIFFIVTSYRPWRSPELTYTLNDLSWITLVIPWMPFMPQMFAFAFAIFSDSRTSPLFPRWLGYANIWVPISFTPATLLPFFKSGPFAWNGLLTLWIPACILIVWFVTVSILVARAVDRDTGPAIEGKSASLSDSSP